MRLVIATRCLTHRVTIEGPYGENLNGRDAMKKLGLIGGMSWESTVSYYQALSIDNEKAGRENIVEAYKNDCGR